MQRRAVDIFGWLKCGAALCTASVESEAAEASEILEATIECQGCCNKTSIVRTSTCPWTVEREVNPPYWRLIHEFGGQTAVQVVMNTSFGRRGEPIVCTPKDPVRTFFSSGMRALVIGDFVVEE